MLATHGTEWFQNEGNLRQVKRDWIVLDLEGMRWFFLTIPPPTTTTITTPLLEPFGRNSVLGTSSTPMYVTPSPRQTAPKGRTTCSKHMHSEARAPWLSLPCPRPVSYVLPQTNATPPDMNSMQHPPTNAPGKQELQSMQYCESERGPVENDKVLGLHLPTWALKWPSCCSE